MKARPRMAVFTQGDEQATFVNMANPVAHPMVFYAKSIEAVLEKPRG